MRTKPISHPAQSIICKLLQQVTESENTNNFVNYPEK